VDSRHPRKLLRYLTEVRGYTVEETSPGIYQVKGDYLPIQIIETKKLSEKENRWLESLRDGLKKSRLNAIFEEGKKWAREINIDAYMDVVLRANKKTILEVGKMKAPPLEEILREAGFLSKWEKQIRVQEREQGKEEVARNALAKGSSPEFVHEITGLPMETIARL